jgi:hypothetical protein
MQTKRTWRLVDAFITSFYKPNQSLALIKYALSAMKLIVLSSLFYAQAQLPHASPL